MIQRRIQNLLLNTTNFEAWPVRLCKVKTKNTSNVNLKTPKILNLYTCAGIQNKCPSPIISTSLEQPKVHSSALGAKSNKYTIFCITSKTKWRRVFLKRSVVYSPPLVLARNVRFKPDLPLNRYVSNFAANSFFFAYISSVKGIDSYVTSCYFSLWLSWIVAFLSLVGVALKWMIFEYTNTVFTLFFLLLLVLIYRWIRKAGYQRSPPIYVFSCQFKKECLF